MEVTLILLAVAAGETLLYLLLIWVTLRVFRRLLAWAEAEGRVPAIQIGSAVILPAPRLAAIMQGALSLARALVLLGLTYGWVSAVLSVFPATREAGFQLAALVSSGFGSVLHAVATYLPNLIQIAIIGALAWYLIAFCRFLFNAAETGRLQIRGLDPELVRPTYQIVRFLIVTLTLVTVFPLLPGHDSKALQGVTIFFGVLVSLASTGTVSNLIAGIVLVYTHSFRTGDRIRVGETLGDVTGRNLFLTRVRTDKKEIVTIPNANILGGHLVNYSAGARESGLVLHTIVTIGYDVPWRQVHEIMLAAAKDTSSVTDDPAPFILQRSLNDYHVSYELNVTTREPGAMMRIYSDLHQNLQDRFFGAGVEILSPAFTSLRDGNTAAIPPAQRPAGYTAPAFRVRRTDGKPDEE